MSRGAYYDWPSLGGTDQLAEWLERSRELFAERARARLREKRTGHRNAPELLDEVRDTECGRRFGVRRVVVISYAAGPDSIGIYPGKDQEA